MLFYCCGGIYCSGFFPYYCISLLLIILMLNAVYFTAPLVTSSLDDWVLGLVESVRFSCLVGTREPGRYKMVSEQGRPEK